MATIAYYRKVLKEEFFQRLEVLSGFLCSGDIIEGSVAANYNWRNRIWTPCQTVWAFLIQVLAPGSSCREAVAHVLAEQAALGQTVRASADPSAYCQSRRRLPAEVFKGGMQKVGQTLQGKVDSGNSWCGRQVWMVDGSSCSTPDTPELQEEFGQPDGQSKGCGFPVAKIVAMFCWASGAVLDVAIGKYRSSELQLWQKLWHLLQKGDVVLGDRLYCTYAYIAQLLPLGCDGVFRLHGARKADFRRGQRLAKNDHIVTWQRPKICPRGMSEAQFQLLPLELAVRQLRFHIDVPGFRSNTIVVVTTLLDAVVYPSEEIGRLYRDRWTVELHLRDIKITLQMDILRGKSADIVRKEIYMHLLVYNLIRALMWQAAVEHDRPLHRLSFAGTIQHLNAVAPYLWLLSGSPRGRKLYQLLLAWIAHDILPNRPNRIEPRVRKRRPKQYSLLNKPRSELRKALIS